MKNEINKLNELSRRALINSTAALTLGVSAGGNLFSETTTSHRGKKVVRIFLSGGCSHLDTFDPKPQSPELMGNTKTVETNTGDILSSYLPEMSKIMDKVALVRSIVSPEGDHNRGTYLFETSYKTIGTIRHPDMGAWMQKLNGKINPKLPSSVSINGFGKGGFLGANYDPFKVSNPKDALKGLVMNEPTSEENIKLLRLMADVRKGFHKNYQFQRAEDYRSYYNEAIRLMQSEDLKAFNISDADKSDVKKYDISHGSSFLLAKQLLQANVQFISIKLGVGDPHNNLWDEFPQRAMDIDKALATFLKDLYDSGLYKSTVVSVNTEFGRTPIITPSKGRDHYRKAFFALLSGAGVKGGTIYGKTDDQGISVVENPVDPIEFNATLAKLAGMDLNREIYSSDNRPFTVARGGKPINSLMA